MLLQGLTYCYCEFCHPIGCSVIDMNFNVFFIFAGGECHHSCEKYEMFNNKSYCWGAGPEMCQKCKLFI